MPSPEARQSRIKPLRFACSWSGGKDSCLAFLRAVDAGLEPVGLLTMLTESGVRSRSHGLPVAVIEAQAAALGLPLVTRATSWAGYEQAFVSALRSGRELGAGAVVYGDIDLVDHRAWDERVSASVGLDAVLPLWQEPRLDLLDELRARGVEALLVAARDGLVSPELLGRTLDRALVEELAELGIDPCGEEGEYHTVVVDAPPFSHRLELRAGERVLRDGVWFLDLELHSRVVAQRTAHILTIGDEIVSGDVENTNGSWLARRLAGLGIEVRMLAALRDDIQAVGGFLAARDGVDFVFVTGGLGGTPDDITREAVAAAFGVECTELPELAGRLRQRFAAKGLADYAARWGRIPRGAVPLDNPLGGAPGFALGNVWVMPGLPSEMEAMFDALAERFRGEPIGSWRRSYVTGEGQIVRVLEEATRLHPAVTVGSYPRFTDDGPEVDVVLKSSDPRALAAATAYLETALAAALGS